MLEGVFLELNGNKICCKLSETDERVYQVITPDIPNMSREDFQKMNNKIIRQQDSGTEAVN